MAALLGPSWAGSSRKSRDFTLSSVCFHEISSSSESVHDVELRDLCSENKEENQPGTSVAANFEECLSFEGC